MTEPTAPRYRHCREWPEGCPEGGHVVPCVVGCELGSQPVRLEAASQR